MMVQLRNFVLLLSLSGTLSAQTIVDHALTVHIDWEKDTIQLEDTVTLPSNTDTEGHGQVFSLNANFEPTIIDRDSKLVPLNTLAGRGAIRQYRVEVPADKRRVTMSYAGKLSKITNHTVAVDKDQPAVKGIYMDRDAAWYPDFENSLVRFSLEVTLPQGWTAVSQGKRANPAERHAANTVRWVESQPQDNIYLIGAPFREYRRSADGIEALVFLRTDDQALAERYLDATIEYVDFYSRLLGPYPYAKFALVENTWESGYGMPSFTLLGPRVIRFPFILHTSYPHEILHNWWGNSVYIDYAAGNWSEGLTAYLADHLIQEQKGRGADYRRAALQKYANYVNRERDFPLTAFRARHGEASQAIGYNKALMLFHMLRRQLGDERFIEGLRRFYSANRFRAAGYTDLQRAFESVGNLKLDTTFAQWTERTGAPALQVGGIRVEEDKEGYVLEAVLTQSQENGAYLLDVPLAVTMEGHAEVLQTTATMKTKNERIQLRLPARPLLLEVDPEFDLFRRLDQHELPPSVGQVYGSERVSVILPAQAAPGVRAAYDRLAQRWVASNPNLEILWDRELNSLPKDRTVWILGWDNRFRSEFERTLKNQRVILNESQLTLEGQELKRSEHSVVLVSRHPHDDQLAMAWLGSDKPAALPGLARKLPHYGKYSFVAFSGDEPTNIAKGQWAVLDSPLRIDLTQQGSPVAAAEHPRRPPLARFGINAGTQD